jgi:hypothetical protein
MPRSTPARAIRMAISLPTDLARFATDTAREEGRTLSAVVQDALRAYRLSRLRDEYRYVQFFWSERARDKGILTARDLEGYLSGKTRKQRLRRDSSPTRPRARAWPRRG